ncbi:MAG: tRNA (guanosine(46)-N7)-methyltransferase TrmB [Rikenellaceae bacterium]
MGKDKLKRFQETLTFKCMVQPKFEEVYQKDYKLKGNWRKDFFKNDNPLILELGCGRGEYTVGLGQMYPDKNFIGIDIKGARMWRGAKTAEENELKNIGFLRTRIEFIDSFFAQNEVDEVWITFADPQLKKNRALKRLTSSRFLAMYSKFLKNDGYINLKTDSDHLHNYTKAICEKNSLKQTVVCDDIYNNIEKMSSDVVSLQTTYESKFLKLNKNITFLKFMLEGKTEFEEPYFEADEMLVKDNDGNFLGGVEVW